MTSTSSSYSSQQVSTSAANMSSRSKSTKTAGSESNRSGADGDSGQINRGFLIGFVDLLRSDVFSSRFDFRNFNIPRALDWMIEEGRDAGENSALRNVYDLCEKKLETTQQRRQLTGKTDDNSKLTLRGVLHTNHVRQIFRASLAIHTFSNNDERVYQLFLHRFNDTRTSSKLLVGTAYFPRILGGGRPTLKLPLDTPSKSEALLYFHCIHIYESLKLSVSVPHGNRIGFALQTIINCWSRFISNVKAEQLGRLSSFIMPYITYDTSTGLFRVIKSRSEGYSTTAMETSLDNCQVVTDVNMVSTTAWNRSDEMDTAARYIVDMMFTHLRTLLIERYLYAAGDENLLKWNILQQYKVPQDVTQVSNIFSQVSNAVTNTLNVIVPEKLLESSDDGGENVTVTVSSDEDENGNSNSGKRKNDGSSAKSNRPDKRHKSNEQSAENDPNGDERPEIKEEALNISIRPLRNKNMSQETSDAYETIIHCEDFKKKYVLLEEDLKDMADVSQDDYGIALQNNVDLLLTDPPYNIRRQGGRENSGHDKFSEEDMKNLATFAFDCLKPGGHGIIFCSFSQFEKYRSFLTDFKTNELDYEKDSTGNEYKVVNVFEVESSPIVFVKKAGYNNLPRRKNYNHVNVVEICVHFWKTGGSEDEAMDRLDYNTPAEYGGPHPSWANVVTEVPIVTGEEIVYQPDSEGIGNTRTRLRPEQKPISLCKFLINKFTKGGDLVVDTCAGTFSTLKACISMDKYRRCVSTDMDEDCAVVVEDDVIEMFSKQLLNQHSDIIGTTADVTQAAQAVARYVEERAVTKRADAWKTPSGLVPIQNFPPHIVQYLCAYHNDFSLYQYRNFAMNRWSLTWIQRMNNVDVQSVRVYEAAMLGLMVKRSTIRHPSSGLGLFTSKAIAKGDNVGYYYGTIVYGDIGSNRRLYKRYGEGILSVSSEEFDKWANEIGFEFIDRSGNAYDAFIVPAPFCVTRFINDPRYLDGDRDGKKNPSKNTKKIGPADSQDRAANVRFSIHRNAKHNSNFERYTAIRVEAVKHINPDEELFIDYGNQYVFE